MRVRQVTVTTARTSFTTDHNRGLIFVVQIRRRFENLFHEIEGTEIRLQRVYCSFQCQQQFSNISLEKETKFFKKLSL